MSALFLPECRKPTNTPDRERWVLPSWDPHLLTTDPAAVRLSSPLSPGAAAAPVPRADHLNTGSAWITAVITQVIDTAAPFPIAPWDLRYVSDERVFAHSDGVGQLKLCCWVFLINLLPSHSHNAKIVPKFLARTKEKKNRKEISGQTLLSRNAEHAEGKAAERSPQPGCHHGGPPPAPGDVPELFLLPAQPAHGGGPTAPPARCRSPSRRDAPANGRPERAAPAPRPPLPAGTAPALSPPPRRSRRSAPAAQPPRGASGIRAERGPAARNPA